MKNILLTIAFIGGLGSVASAQQLPLYTQYRNALEFINPASVHAGFFQYEYNVQLNTSYRAQWISQPETPRTLQLSGNYITNWGGAFELVSGLMLLKDQTGPSGLTGAYGRIGSLFTRDPYMGAFGIGFSFGWVNYRLSASQISWKDPDDPNIPLFDRQINRPDIGVGLFYYKRLSGGFFDEDNLYLGLSVPQILGAQSNIIAGKEPDDLPRVAHFYFNGGWLHYINENSFFEFSTWAKYVSGAPLNVDLNFRFQPGRTLWVGGGYNINGMIHLEGGLHMPGLLWDDSNLSIGYSFDYSLSAFGLQLGTGHEINLALQFDTF